MRRGILALGVVVAVAGALLFIVPISTSFPPRTWDYSARSFTGQNVSAPRTPGVPITEVTFESRAAEGPAAGFGGVEAHASIPTGGSISGMTYDPVRALIYIANSGYNTVQIVAGTSLVANVSVAGGPLSPTFDPANGLVYVPCRTGNNVSVLAGLSQIASLPSGSGPDGATFDPFNDLVYITNGNSDNVTVYNGTTVVGNVLAGLDPQPGAVDTTDGWFYVPNYFGNNVTVISGTKVVGTLSTGTNNPTSAAYDPHDGDVYVAQTGNVSVVRGGSSIASLPIGPNSVGPTYDPQDEEMYFSLVGQVFIVNGTSISTTLSISGAIGIPVFDGSDGLMYLPAGSGHVVFLVNATSEVATVQVGTFPLWETFDSADHWMYVDNAYSSNLTVLEDVPRYSVGFGEEGLPVGMNWAVDFNGTTSSSYGSAVNFSGLRAGVYLFSVIAVAGFVATTNASSPIRMNSNLTISVSFVHNAVPRYPVWFNATGALPSGSTWSVDLYPNGSGNTTGTSVALDLVNGSYLYTIPPAGHFGALPTAGALVVSGKRQTIVVSFSPVSNLTFFQSGLGAGSNWSVDLSAPNSTIIQGGVVQGGRVSLLGYSGTVGQVRFLVSSGMFEYTATAPGMSSKTGTLSVTPSGSDNWSVSYTVDWTSGAESYEPIAGLVVIASIAVAAATGAWVVVRRRRRRGP